MKISKRTFGVLSNGKKVHLYTLSNGDIALSISTLGAAWTSLIMPGKKGKEDVLLGFSSLEGYLLDSAYIGVTIGRFANRVENAAFTLKEKKYQLNQNDGVHSLHGGRRGFGKKVWEAFPFEDKDGVYIRFDYNSPDGEEGYPGNCEATVIYGLIENNTIIADYRARVDAPSPVNLTNHAYFNLAGEGSGDILSHKLLLNASSYLDIRDDLIPTGTILPAAGTPFDFTSSKPIGKDFAAVCKGNTAAIGTGYDHCFIIDGREGKTGKEKGEIRHHERLSLCAELEDPLSGRFIKLSTTQPGVQLYTGNNLNGVKGKTGSLYNKNAGLCLETQHFPDSPNQNGFPDSIFGPERKYSEMAVFSLGW